MKKTKNTPRATGRTACAGQGPRCHALLAHEMQ
jgi:hypothetical protein